MFSSGLFGAFRDASGRRGGAAASASPGADDRPLLAREWEDLYRAQLSNPALKKGLRLWFMTGKEDSSLSLTQATVDLLKKHGFSPTFKETAGGHTTPGRNADRTRTVRITDVRDGGNTRARVGGLGAQPPE